MEEESSYSSEEASEQEVGQVFTTEQIVYRGLRAVNFRRKRIKRAGRKRNIQRFVGHFGSEPQVVAEIWEDLQRPGDPEARVPPQDLDLKKFLMAMHFLKRYPTELEREPIFDIDPQQGRDAVWYYVEKFQALKVEKIVWPEDNFGDDIWVITVDGTHCWIHEPGHPEWSQDSDWYSHKYGKAGVCYELGIALATSRLVWMNGPFKAGESDLRIAKKRGLIKKLRSIKKRAIADGGYVGYPDVLSTPNALDSIGCRKFKSRALKRHEKFNSMTKTFDCLAGRFRHSVESFKTVFEAVCVICQYQCEFGSPLYDILIEGL